jgi:twitching motility protein PilU
MQTFDQALLKLYKDGKVTMDEALANADSRANLESQIHFG